MTDNIKGSAIADSHVSLVKKCLVGSIFVAIRTGGMGKTTTVQIIEYALSRKNVSFDLVSLDVAEKGASSKLKKVLDQTEDMVFGASMEAISQDPNAALQNFDDLGQRLARGGAIFDFGANIAPVVFGWAKVGEIHEYLAHMPKITLVVPVTAQSQAIDDAIAIIKEARGTISDLPIAKIIVVYNERDGKFGNDIARYADLVAETIAKDDGIEMKSVVLPKLLSEIWNKIQAKNMPFADAIRLSAAELERDLGLPLMQAGRGKKFFRDWLNAAELQFLNAGIAS